MNNDNNRQKRKRTESELKENINNDIAKNEEKRIINTSQTVSKESQKNLNQK